MNKYERIVMSIQMYSHIKTLYDSYLYCKYLLRTKHLVITYLILIFWKDDLAFIMKFLMNIQIYLMRCK